MTPLIAPASSLHIRRVSRCLFIGMFLSGVGGCVSQQTYDTTRTEADELARALETARTDMKEVEQHIATLDTLNQKEGAALAEARAAIQQDTEASPMVRQRADDRLAALQTQVAYLVNQNRLLARDMSGAKQEGVSLQALVTQYKQEMEDIQPLPSSFPSTSSLRTPSPEPVSIPSLSSPIPTPAPATTVTLPPSNSSMPTQAAAAPHVVKPNSAPMDDSWTGMLKTWVSTVWGWIFG
jgi:hypothetical protein